MNANKTESKNSTDYNKLEQGYKDPHAKDSFLVLIVGLLLCIPNFADFGWIIIPQKAATNFKEMLFQIGIALIIMSIVTVYLGLRDTAKYFRDRLKEIILDSKYIQEISDEELTDLEMKLLKRRYKNTQIDKEGSFLNYMKQKINVNISSPYREHVSSIFTISENGENEFLVNETFTFTCRAMNGTIQDSVYLRFDQKEYENLDDLQYSIKCPNIKGEKACASCQFNGLCDDNRLVKFPKGIFFEDNRPKYIGPQNLNSDVKGPKDNSSEISNSETVHVEDEKSGWKSDRFTLRFDERTQKMDGLQVEIFTRYKVKKDSLLYWYFIVPSKDVNIRIVYPKTYLLQIYIAGVEKSDYLTNDHDGLKVISFEGWLIPRTGIAFCFRKKDA